jgi:hypothetical protein
MIRRACRLFSSERRTARKFSTMPRTQGCGSPRIPAVCQPASFRDSCNSHPAQYCVWKIFGYRPRSRTCGDSASASGRARRNPCGRHLGLFCSRGEADARRVHVSAALKQKRLLAAQISSGLELYSLVSPERGGRHQRWQARFGPLTASPKYRFPLECCRRETIAGRLDRWLLVRWPCARRMSLVICGLMGSTGHADKPTINYLPSGPDRISLHVQIRSHFGHCLRHDFGRRASR